VKVLDETSPLLVANTLFGVDYPKVTLTYSRTVGAGQADYFTIVANNASIANIQESGSNENPTESVSIHATSYTVTYVPQLASGAMGTPITTTLACN